MDHQPSLLVNEDIKSSESHNERDDLLQSNYNPCGCNDCLHSNNLSTLSDNIDGNNKEGSDPSTLTQKHIIEQVPSISTPKKQQEQQQQQQQKQQKQFLDHNQIYHHNQIHHVPKFNTMNSPTNYTELLRIGTSEFEIIIRKKFLPNLINHGSGMRDPQRSQEQSSSGNRVSGRIQNRMRPYQMPYGHQMSSGQNCGRTNNRCSNTVLTVNNTFCQCCPKATLTLPFY